MIPMDPERPLEVPFRRLRSDARAPSRAYGGDAGYDLTAAGGAVLPPGGRAVIGTGVAVAVPAGYAGLVLPRSGLAVRHGVSLVNAPGTIDAGYRGEVKVLLVNLADAPAEIARGDRVAQLLLQPVGRAVIVESDALEATSRGSGGFGSSGTGPPADGS